MRRRASKLLLVAACAVGLVVATVLAVAGVALATTAGARMSIAAVTRLVPGTLSIERVDGSLLHGLALTNLRYESPAMSALVGRIEIGARLGEIVERRLVVARLAIDDAALTLHDSGAAPAEPSGDPPALPEIPEWLALEALRVRNVALAPAGITLHALDASVAGPEVSIAALDATIAGGRVEASARARVAGDAIARIDGAWTAATDGADARDTRIELGADLELAASATPWRATLIWDRLAAQAAGTAWSSSSGRVTATPGTRPIEVALSAELASPLTPTPATITGLARVDGSAVDLEELALDTLGGRVVTRGVVDLAALAGYASVEFAMLDPSLIEARLEGTLHGSAVAAFAAKPEPAVGATGTLGGTLGGRPLDGALRASLRGRMLDIDRARVVLETSVIELAGRVADERVELTFAADVPELTNWYPPAAGSVRAAGTVAGPASDPTIDVEVRAAGLAVEPSPPLDSLTLDVTGTLAAHVARAAAQSRYGSLDVSIEQGWNRNREALSGTVRESRLEVDRAGTWTLTAPAAYSVSGPRATLEPLCYAGPQQARLCASLAEDMLNVDATAMPSALAEPWLDGVELDGAADLALTFGWRPAPHGSLRLAQRMLRLRQRARPDAEAPTAGDFASIDDLLVTATLTEQALLARLTASLSATGDPLELRASLAPPTSDGLLDASLSAQLTSLELLDALVEDVEQVTGSAAIDLRAAGSLGAPMLEGELVVRSLGAVVPRLGIEITGGRLSARPAGLGALDITGAVCSEGCVELDGRLDVGERAAPWRATATLRGDSFALANLDELRAVVAPDLALDATPEAWRVTGALAIEDGLVAVAGVPRTAVRPVPETVVHGRSAEPEEAALPLPLVVDVGVRLGEVRFEGLGLSAELDGSLDIDRTAEGQLLVNGTASIEEGTFRAYSQELAIERGDLLFTGPSDNPALDVRATREVDGATVGLAVTGTLRNPQSEVFSMPALPESEALARLVTGRSLQSAGTADAEAIERAALGLGIRRALPALERLGGNLGLDELGVSSGSSGDSALVAGRQLGEDVYLRYKHGLFDDFAGFELIYRITERFRLRTETGTSQSIDLLYERNREENAPNGLAP